jgi:hypothetical protein
MTYEQGFAQGELDAFRDRQGGYMPDRLIPAPETAFQRGYLDGYTPRSPTWWVPARTPQMEAA